MLVLDPTKAWLPLWGLLLTTIWVQGAPVDGLVTSPQCDNLNDAIQNIEQVQAYLQGMLFGGLPLSASDAHDMVSQIFEALEKPVAEVKALRDTTCQLQLFRRTHLVERQDSTPVCKIIDQVHDELVQVDGMADKLAALPGGDLLDTPGIKEQLANAEANLKTAQRLFRDAGSCPGE
ncbi:uncharacterized protein E0L32_002563 [Thyridium curvatum]|uniref:Uncharacterized protein n=1 Tax=Thyridium curvatum TaxID=1093900 RepID=A0A507BH69_9PEZI|nr:uncharacterized protein E0L32_002563 [Thyridium curvatum]TPX18706.1 hypothetical protein E0L32_002563 [Thyridium curvatum]